MARTGEKLGERESKVAVWGASSLHDILAAKLISCKPRGPEDNLSQDIRID